MEISPNRYTRTTNLVIAKTYKGIPLPNHHCEGMCLSLIVPEYNALRLLAMYPSLLLALFAITTKPVLGNKHQLYSGFFAGSQLYGIQFDDETSTLTVVNNITTKSSDGSKWIAIDVCHLSI